MPEILTESFCERCGTRYTFESTAPRAKRIGRFKTLSKGLKNFVMSDDSSLDEALALARSEEEREAVSQQLDAFHKTFNFCMTCRQYTCSNCWNEVEGRCLTCAPQLGHEILPSPFPQLESNGNGAHAESPSLEAWPTVDLRPTEPPAPPTAAEAWPEVDELPATDLAARLAALGVPPSDADDVEPTAEPAANFDPEPEAAEAEPSVEVAAFEPEPEAAEAAAFEPEPEAVEAEPAVEVAALEPEAVADDADLAVASVAPEEPLEPELPVGFDAEPESGATALVPEQVAPTEPESVATVDERAAAASAQTSALLGRFRPGQSLDDALAAYEAAAGLTEKAEPSEPAPGPEPVAAFEPEPEPEPELMAPEPVALEPEPEPEPLVAEPVAAFAPALEPEPEPEPVAAFEPAPEPESSVAEPAAAPSPDPEPTLAAEPFFPPDPEPAAAPTSPPRDDRVEVPAWRIVAPDAPAAADGHPAPAPAPAPVPEPQLPAAATAEPQWPRTPQSDALAFLTAKLTRSSEDLWSASNREVLSVPPVATAAPAIQACVSCGLSLSTTARFCRRCGTRQG